MFRKQSVLSTAALIAAAALPAALGRGAAGAAIINTSFQNGANGYNGAVNTVIGSNIADTPDATAATRTSLNLDGYGATNASPDRQALFRFDDLFGSALGQVPAGATIIDARLDLTTHTGSNSQSPGPWGAAALLAPFDPATATYNGLAVNPADTPGTAGNRGAWYQNGTATRPMAGIGNMALGQKVSLNVTPFAHAWSTGQLANNGLVLQAGFVGTIDGWTPRSVNYDTVEDRPRLSVAYTTDPIDTARLQQGANGYNDTIMALVEREPTSGTDLTTDGKFISQEFLDEGAGSNNPRAAIRFDNLAASLNVPAGAEVLSAYLVVTTGDASGNARSPGLWRLDELGAAWDPTTLYSQFGPTGPEGTQVSALDGMLTGSEAWFDVTGSVERWLDGSADNNGWVLRSAGTSDGWQVHFTGTEEIADRPELIVTYQASVPEPAALALAAFAALPLLRRSRRR